MGIFSGPERVKRPNSEATYFALGQGYERDATSFASGLRARISGLMNPSNERAQAVRTASADAWQADAANRGYDAQRPGLFAFGRQLAAGKARTRAVLSGANEQTFDLLNRRGALRAVGSQLRRGQTTGWAGFSAAQDASNAAISVAKQQSDANIAGGIGTMVGYGAGAAASKFQKWYAAKQPPAASSSGMSRDWA